MARINIESGFWSDDRFLLLVEKIGLGPATGSAVIAFKVAQKFWVPDLKLIPAPSFRSIPNYEDLLSVGFAEAKDGGELYYIRGSEKQFSWLLQKHAAGERGGLARNGGVRISPEESKRRSFASRVLNKAVQSGVVKKPERCSSCSAKTRLEGHHHDYAKPLSVVWLCRPCHSRNHRRNSLAKVSESERIEPSSLLSPFSEELIHSAPPVGGCADTLESIYKEYPRRLGGNRKADGLKRLAKGVKTPDDFKLLSKAVLNYRAYCDGSGKTGTEYVMQFATWTSNWHEWAELSTPTTSRVITTEQIESEFNPNGNF